jgi:class 3 adenylate cyclase
MAEERVQRRLAAILAADVVGYSRLMGEDEAGTLAALKAHREALMDPKIAEHQGRIVKTTGDGMLVEFPSVVEAVQCAVEIQKEMVERNTGVAEDRRMLFRIGINVGDVIFEGDDIFGDGVNIAARLEAMADPGGICISQAVLGQVKQKLALDLEDLGNTALKNIEEPVRTYRIVHAGQTEMPAVATSTVATSSKALPPLSKRPSVAIMPFRNLNEDAQNDYIANGIGLGIQTLLVQLSGLFLVNANAHQGYREGKVTAAEAVRELPVRYVLEGAVQHAGQHVRVMVQLTDLHDIAVIWADRYDRDLEDVFALQDDITREVIFSLGSEILSANLDRIWTRGLTGEGAWEYFLRGVSHFYKFTKNDNAIARDMFEKIYHLHPDKAIGPAYIATTYWFDATRGWADSPAASIRQARKWAEKSIEPEEENNGLGHVILGSIRLREGRHEEGLALCRKGVAFRASCPLTLGQLADAQLYCGDAHGAVKSAREALALRMLYPPPLVNLLATAYRDSGEIDLSIPAAREAADLDPQHTDAFVTLCSDYVLAGLDDEAHRIAGQIIEIDPEFRISSYANNLPYRDATKIASIVETLRSAGLPD